MKNITLSVLLALSGTASLPALAQTEPLLSGADMSVVSSEQQFSDAELDSMLAPIALYPDTLLSHILIAATYPLDVVAADRWRQSNQHLTPEQVENVLESVTWDPSVKALAPFTDLLNTMASDLEWLQQLGDSVLISEARVLDRVQILRQHAHNTGNLVTNDYIEVEREREREREIIYIAPRQREVVYVPFYNPHVVYGNWWHATSPIYWHHRVSYHHHHNVFWAPRVRLSSFFYFGGLHWHNRYVVVHRQPVRHFYHGSPRKRVVSNGYQRWQHRSEHRRARYSSRVVHNAPPRYTKLVQTKSRHSPVVRTTASPRNNLAVTKREISANTSRTLQANKLSGRKETAVNVHRDKLHNATPRKQKLETTAQLKQTKQSQLSPSREATLQKLKQSRSERLSPVSAKTAKTQRITSTKSERLARVDNSFRSQRQTSTVPARQSKTLKTYNERRAIERQPTKRQAPQQLKTQRESSKVSRQISNKVSRNVASPIRAPQRSFVESKRSGASKQTVRH